MMGDNRDNSTDSRVPADQGGVGYVPFENIEGRAQMIFFSVGEGAAAWEFWRWPWTLRINRIFKVGPMKAGTVREPDSGRACRACRSASAMFLPIRRLLARALTHVSALPAAQAQRRVNSYQRLEFLGDRVLGLAVSRNAF